MMAIDINTYLILVFNVYYIFTYSLYLYKNIYLASSYLISTWYSYVFTLDSVYTPFLSLLINHKNMQPTGIDQCGYCSKKLVQHTNSLLALM